MVLTPDENKPRELNRVYDDRVAWSSFETFVQILNNLVDPGDDLLSDKPIPAERETLFLRELVRFFNSENLVRTGNQVLVVAVRIAFSEYRLYHAYICQLNRSFQRTSRIVFYANGRIDKHIPYIVDVVEAIGLTEEAISEQLKGDTRMRMTTLYTSLKQDQGDNLRRDTAKVMFLSFPESEDTIKLEQDIVNDLTSDSGRTTAFIQAQ